MAKKKQATQGSSTGKWHSAPCSVRPCKCQHEYQDGRYGKGLRLHNPAHGSGDGIAWVCTVCGTKH